MRPAASAARLRTRLLGQPMPGGRGPEVFQQVFGSPLGASDARVIARHILPNALSPLIVQASFNMGEAILIAAGLSFIGFGAQPPTPEWGVMISEGRDYIHDAVVGAHVPGPGHSPGGHGVQSGGRRPARPARSAPAARRLTSGDGCLSS